MKVSHLAASIAAFTVVGAVGSTASAAVVSFDSASDLSLFTLNAAANGAVTWSATAGVGGGGGLSITGDGRVHSYNASSFDLSSIPGLVVQLDAKDSLATDTGIANRVGLFGDVGLGFASPSFYADYNDAVLRIILNGNGTNPTAVPITTTNGNWNRLVMTVVDLGSTLSVEAQLYDLGATGTSTPNLLGTISTTTTSALATDTSVYGGFKLGNAGTVRATAGDNFVVAAIPEPASLSLIAGLGGMLLRRRSRA